MSINTNANAAFAIQSHWLRTDCSNPPDFILGNTDVWSTIPFSGLVYNGLGFCGWEWVKDCSSPGICSASLDLDMSSGYKSFQNSYLDALPNSFNDWLFPKDAKGEYYCVISTDQNNTALILAGSSYCYMDSMKCTTTHKLHLYPDTGCVGIPTTIVLSPTSESVTINQTPYDLSIYRIGNGTESIDWTTYISSLPNLVQEQEQLWIASLVCTIIAILIAFFHLIISTTQYLRSKRWNYLAYSIGFSLNIVEVIAIFLAWIQCTIPGYVSNFAYGLASGFTVTLNTAVLMEIVFHSKSYRILILSLFTTLYVFFGFPFVLNVVYMTGDPSPVKDWMMWYFNSISYIAWQVICYVFEPATAITILIYIVQSCLKQSTFWTSMKILFSDKKLMFLCSISLGNSIISIFLQFATTYTLFANNDKRMIFYQTIFSIQHTINSCCTLWYCLYFPQVLQKLKLLQSCGSDQVPKMNTAIDSLKMKGLKLNRGVKSSISFGEKLTRKATK
ncbi:hypothetical protein BC833DRAFT_610359 [Globomyces pollinis-pini]|nr:hypothetical protein BC833DRAFT_610359 [Globomyces pollinis-pini]